MTYEAGPELDRLVAEAVMGLEFITGNDALMSPDKFIDVNGDFYAFPRDFRPSTEIGAAWIIVSALRKIGRYVTLTDCGNHWDCALYRHEEDEAAARADTAPLAICLAALKVKRTDREGGR